MNRRINFFYDDDSEHNGEWAIYKQMIEYFEPAKYLIGINPKLTDAESNHRLFRHNAFVSEFFALDDLRKIPTQSVRTCKEFLRSVLQNAGLLTPKEHQDFVDAVDETFAGEDGAISKFVDKFLDAQIQKTKTPPTSIASGIFVGARAREPAIKLQIQSPVI